MSPVPLLALVMKKSKYKIKPTTMHPSKKVEKKIYAPDHGNSEEASLQICEYVIPNLPGARKAFVYSSET